MIASVEEQVVAAERRLREAQFRSDVAVLDELVAADVLFAAHTGQLISKQDDLDLHEARGLRLEIAEVVEEEWRIFRGFGMVSVVLHLVGSFMGTPIDQNMRYNRVWRVEDDGVVRLVGGSMGEVRE